MTHTRKRLVAQALAIAALSIGIMTAPAPVHAGGKAPNARKLDAVMRRLAKVQEEAAQDYLKGDAARALARLDAVVDRDDWEGMLAMGNMTWTMHPAESLQWHQRAYAASKQNDHVLLELAYHYTRRDECTQAVAAWKQIDQAGLLGTYMPMLAGYCYLKLGDDKQAFAMFDRAQSGGHGRFEAVLGELWGPRPALAQHAEQVQALKATGAVANLEAGLENAMRFGMGEMRGAALLALTDATQPYAANLGEVTAQLQCLRPAFAKEAEHVPAQDSDDYDTEKWMAAEAASEAHDAAIKATWKQQLENCKLVLGKHPLPNNPIVARVLVANTMKMDLASAKDLLAAHGAALDARAHSQAGDFEALRLLAALQSEAGDPGISASDELGWSRYSDAKLAAGRIVGKMLEDKQASPEVIALIDRAHTQFPHDQMLLQLWLRYGNPSMDAARQGWRELALLEFHIQTGQSTFSIGPSAAMLHTALRNYREAAGL